MQVVGNVRTHVQATIEPEESWQLYNGNGYPFKVRVLFYTGDDGVTLRGWAIKADGSQGYIERTAYHPLDTIPAHIAEVLVSTYRHALEEALAEYAR